MMARSRKQTPKRVFVSYTGEDLRAHADAVMAAIRKLRWVAIDHRDWASNGEPSVEWCVNEVKDCDVCVVLVAHRYGWVPPKSKGGDGKKSIVRIEAEAARRAGLEVLPFLVDSDSNWPPKHIEALSDPSASKPLAAFKKVLNATIRGTFTNDPARLEGDAFRALTEAGARLDAMVADAPAESAPAERAAPRAVVDRTRYLKHVAATYGSVVLTGLLGNKAAPAVPIEDVYVPLRTTRTDLVAERGAERAPERSAFADLVASLASDVGGRTKKNAGALERRVTAALVEFGVPEAEAGRPDRVRAIAERLLEEGAEPSPERVREILMTVEFEDAFRGARHLLVEGDPGSGKTTTLFHVAMSLVRAHAGGEAWAARMGFTSPWPLPIVVVLRRFRAWLGGRPPESRSADVLLDYLREAEGPLGGPGDWLPGVLESGGAAVLLDGVDEVADTDGRDRAASILQDFIQRFGTCRFVVTSRPAGLSGDVRHKLVEVGGLTHCMVRPLDKPLQARFVRSWYGALITDPKDAERRATELIARIESAPKVAALADTPIMLTAIAVVHQTLGHLPEKRAELYEHCVRALAGRWDEARDEHGKALCGPLSLDAKVGLLEEVAYRVHEHGTDAAAIERGPLVTLACEEFGRALGRPLDRDAGQNLVDHMGERSGLLVPAGPRDFRFRHLTFQEFLAARRICDRADDPVAALGRHLADAWWREVVTLAAGHKASYSTADAKRLVVGLIERATSIDDAPARVAAFAAIAPALLDLRKYAVPWLTEVSRSSFAALVPLLDDPTCPGGDADRSTLADLLGSFGPDPRLRDDRRWVRIPAGTFEMGEGVHTDELPVHAVQVPAFELHRWSVTVAEYARFVDAGGYGDRGKVHWDSEGWAWRERERVTAPSRWDGQVARPTSRPVIGVSWWECDAYCRWLGARLPSEAEWEYACRAGTTTGYWSGDEERDLARVGWYDGNSTDRVHAVGEKPANPWGLFDMHGNVWEWCEDAWHPNYEGAPTDGSAWTAGASGDRVIRGGGWYASARDARSAYRFRFYPGLRYGFLGFRPARSVTSH